jgi:hypothetical protein
VLRQKAPDFVPDLLHPGIESLTSLTVVHKFQSFHALYVKWSVARRPCGNERISSRPAALSSRKWGCGTRQL